MPFGYIRCEERMKHKRKIQDPTGQKHQSSGNNLPQPSKTKKKYLDFDRRGSQ